MPCTTYPVEEGSPAIDGGRGLKQEARLMLDDERLDRPPSMAGAD